MNLKQIFGKVADSANIKDIDNIVRIMSELAREHGLSFKSIGVGNKIECRIDKYKFSFGIDGDLADIASNVKLKVNELSEHLYEKAYYEDDELLSELYMDKYEKIEGWVADVDEHLADFSNEDDTNKDYKNTLKYHESYSDEDGEIETDEPYPL